jgi:hypothetical protein
MVFRVLLWSLRGTESATWGSSLSEREAFAGVEPFAGCDISLDIGKVKGTVDGLFRKGPSPTFLF